MTGVGRMTLELFALIAFHFACSDISEQRPMTAAEVQTCSVAYQKIKLHFVPDVTVKEYVMLPASEREHVNNEGFREFLKWRQDNPSTVKYLERVARSEVKLGAAV